jgi:hypothetical protein
MSQTVPFIIRSYINLRDFFGDLGVSGKDNIKNYLKETRVRGGLESSYSG